MPTKDSKSFKAEEPKTKMPTSEMVFPKEALTIVHAEADDNPIIKDVEPVA